MNIDWKKTFTKATPKWKDAWTLEEPVHLNTLSALKNFLDLVHIKYCLLKPFCELSDYPLVETRELLPSFESDLWEHKKLPGFSLVALARPLSYFSEVFQYDQLKAVGEYMRTDRVQNYIARNMSTLLSRLPRSFHDPFRHYFHKSNVGSLNTYPSLTPYLANMDRAQVIGMHGQNPQDMSFYLAGVYASFPSDLDTEIKRYGLRIGKFSVDDPDLYEQNRIFVLQRLMELYGFPIASERRTSAALFARRLHKMGERFLIRTLGQTDRTLSTMWSDGGNRYYPHVEKIALVKLEDNNDGLLEQLRLEGYLLDENQAVAILRIRYRQHKFSQDNVRQERALSVESLEVIHPLTGLAENANGLIKDTTSMFLRLNDIVRGEHSGRIVYKRNEVVENTDSEEKRLKFLYAWLTKHQRRFIGYRDEFFANVEKVLNNYLYPAEDTDKFASLSELYQEVENRFSYILQARKIRVLEELKHRVFKGSKISYAEMLAEAVELLHSLKFEIVNYFDSLTSTIISIGESILNDRYLARTYIEVQEESLSQNGLEIKKNYGKLVTLIDEFRSIQKTRRETENRAMLVSTH